jgi:S1-C subfamily serine protease
VCLTKLGGRGVVVPGGLILTAAHCVGWSNNESAGMALGDHYLEHIRTADGRKLVFSVAAVEPVADIAVLRPPDDQSFPGEYIAANCWVSGLEPVRPFGGDLWSQEDYPVLVYHKDKTWGRATATIYDANQPTVWLKSEKFIKGGASGGPIVTTAGESVGIVSFAHGSATPTADPYPHDGVASRPSHALPGWVLNRIKEA